MTLSEDVELALQSMGIINPNNSDIFAKFSGMKEIPTTASNNSLVIRIAEEPLTAQNLTTIISALTELHTKSWLIEQGRFADLIAYTQTRNPRLSEEAPLIIAKIAHNSPTLLELIPNSMRLAESLKIAIDAIIQAPLRYHSMMLENRKKALELKEKEQKVALTISDKEQARFIEAKKAEIALQREIIELEKQQLKLEKERFGFETKRVEYSLKASILIVDTLRPNTDEGTKAMLAQTLIPNLLQLSNGKGVELALPASKNSQEVEENNQL